MEYLIPALFCLQALIWRAALRLPCRRAKIDEETFRLLASAMEKSRQANGNSIYWLEVQRQRLQASLSSLENQA